jgi:hypothetical protein
MVDTVHVWVSTADQTMKLTKGSDVNFNPVKVADPPYTIIVNDKITFQKWIGCGACTKDILQAQCCIIKVTRAFYDKCTYHLSG